MKSTLKTISLELNKNKLHLIGFCVYQHEENNHFTMIVDVQNIFYLKMTTYSYITPNKQEEEENPQIVFFNIMKHILNKITKIRANEYATWHLKEF